LPTKEEKGLLPKVKLCHFRTQLSQPSTIEIIYLVNREFASVYRPESPMSAEAFDPVSNRDRRSLRRHYFPVNRIRTVNFPAYSERRHHKSHLT
jgi:hypothetical protein